jgi:hypothetical protein
MEAIDQTVNILVCWCPGNLGIDGNKLANTKAAKALNLDFLDPSICVSLATKKTRLLLSTPKIWKGSPRTSFLVQTAFHQLQFENVHLNLFQFKSRKSPFPI